MSERKVLNKYYPPDFDASKLPRVKREKNRQFTIRLMAPFNMRCKTCGEYIYRGKKFNARKEDVIGQLYLGIQIYRFYIKCTKCLAEITFLTDPENQDYAMENGAIRNFESLRLAEKQAETEAKQAKEEEENNPMKILENRTRDSRREMAVLETLEDLREMNAANLTVDPTILFEEDQKLREAIEQQEQDEDEAEIRRIFGKKSLSSQVFDIIVDDEEANNGDDSDKIESSSSSKKHKLGQEKIVDDDKTKKIKIEETAEKVDTFSSVLFPKVSQTSKESTAAQSVVGQLSKSNVASFIKKKTIVVKSEPVIQQDFKTPETSSDKPVLIKIEETKTAASKTVVNSLANLLNAYDDSSESEES